MGSAGRARAQTGVLTNQAAERSEARSNFPFPPKAQALSSFKNKNSKTRSVCTRVT